MANLTLERILQMHKEGRITSDEAEMMIGSLKNGEKHTAEPDWDDDNAIRIVAYRGRRMLRAGGPGESVLMLEYQGDAVNIDSHISVTCGNVQGNVNAGTSITCASIAGHAEAGTSIECSGIIGNAEAGSSIRCHGNIGGNAEAGAGIHIIKE